MSKDEIEKIKADIIRSGLPCEIETTIKLRSAGWEVTNQNEYIDEETGKSRSIDAHAWKIHGDLPQTLLVIECCKSVKPWVFHGSWRRWDFPTVFPWVLPPAEAGFKLIDSEFAAVATCSHQKHKGIYEASISYEPFRKGKGTEIFDASIKVIKALRYERTRIWEFAKEYVDIKQPNITRIFYPIIVFDGNLYSLYFRTKKPYPKKREYLRFLVGFKGKSYLIDVVTKSGFSKYLVLLEKEFNCQRKFKSSPGSLS